MNWFFFLFQRSHIYFLLNSQYAAQHNIWCTIQGLYMCRELFLGATCIEKIERSTNEHYRHMHAHIYMNIYIHDTISD